MLEVVSKEFKQKKINGGRKRKHGIPILISLFLKYYRHYFTMDYLSNKYKCSESTICRIIDTIEQILINCKKFTIQGNNKLENSKNTKLVIDVTETEIERPKKNQKAYYSGKKKKHTLKTQVIANIETGEIYSINIAKGKVHDFQIYKDSRIFLNNTNTIIADSGYQGIQKLHKNSTIPDKKSKGKELTKDQKKNNKLISSKRIIIEHINRFLKIFRIVSNRYRNKHNKFGLRMNLIAGIYNLERLQS
jgi:IS5 family transposase